MHVVTVMTVGSTENVLLDETIGFPVTPEIGTDDEVIVAMLLVEVELEP